MHIIKRGSWLWLGLDFLRPCLHMSDVLGLHPSCQKLQILELDECVYGCLTRIAISGPTEKAIRYVSVKATPK